MRSTNTRNQSNDVDIHDVVNGDDGVGIMIFEGLFLGMTDGSVLDDDLEASTSTGECRNPSTATNSRIDISFYSDNDDATRRDELDAETVSRARPGSLLSSASPSQISSVHSPSQISSTHSWRDGDSASDTSLSRGQQISQSSSQFLEQKWPGAFPLDGIRECEDEGSNTISIADNVDEETRETFRVVSEAVAELADHGNSRRRTMKSNCLKTFKKLVLRCFEIVPLMWKRSKSAMELDYG